MKKFTTLVLALAMLLSVMIPSLAVSDSVSLAIKNFIAPMYADKSGYTIYDFEGNDITEYFIENTISFALKNDWEEIVQFYSQNVSFARYTEYSQPISRNYDIGKSQVDLRTCNFETPYGIGVEGTYKQYSSIYYNPNTGHISNCNSYIGDVRIPNEYITLKDEQLVTTFLNNYTAVSMTLRVCFQYGTPGSSYYINYGYIPHSVTMSSES